MTPALLGLLARRHRLSIGAALLAPILLGLVAGGIYPDLRAQREALEAIPFVAQFLKSDFADPFSAASILVLPYKHPLSLTLWAVLPAIPALGLPAGERGRGSLDLLLSTPLERRQLIRALSLFGVLLLPFVMVSPLLGTVIAHWSADELDVIRYGRLWMASAVTCGLVAFWGGTALVVSVLARDRVSGTFWFAVIVFVMFALDSASRLARGAAWMAHWTPYGYFRPTDVVGGSDQWVGRAAGLFLAGALLAWIACELQHRRRSA